MISLTIVTKTILLIFWNIVAGPTFWIADFPNAPGAPDAQYMALPAELPQQVHITGCYIGRQTANSAAGQFAASIDPGHVSYDTGVTVPYHQGGKNIDAIPLCSLWTNEGKHETPFKLFSPAVIWKRDEGDRLWIQNDGPAPGDTYWLVLHYAVDDPAATVPPVPTLVGWNNIFFSPTNSTSSGWSDVTQAVVFDPRALSTNLTGAKTRVSIAADNVTDAFICPRVPGSVMQAYSCTRLTFGGLNGATSVGGAPLVSDDVPSGISVTYGFIVKYHIAAGPVSSFRYSNSSNTGATSWWIPGNDAANTNGTGYTRSSVDDNGVSAVAEQY